MTYGALDHLFVALLALTAPLLGVWAFRRMTAALATGDAGARIRNYRRAIGLELVDGALILVLWAGQGVRWKGWCASIGFRRAGGPERRGARCCSPVPS